jgi:hypothetical protein
VFEPRTVQIGWRSGDRVAITHGLAEGERVVVEGTFLVDSETRLKTPAPRPDYKNAQPTNPSKTWPAQHRIERARFSRRLHPARGVTVFALQDVDRLQKPHLNLQNLDNSKINDK